MKISTYSLYLVNISLLSFLILPVFNAPIGRVGGEIIIFFFLLPIMVRSFDISDIKTLSPIWLGIISVLLTWLATYQKNNLITFLDGLIPTLSYCRNLFFALLGLYMGKKIKPEDFKQVVKLFLLCALIITLFAIGQAHFQFCRDLTINYYTPPIDSYEQFFTVLKERPSSTLDRTWAYSYFSAVIFLSSISFPGFLRPRFFQFFITIIFFTGLIYSGTRSAVLSVVTGLFFLIFINSDVFEKKKNIIVKILGLMIVMIIPVIVYTYNFDRLDWFYNPFLIGISGAVEEVQYSNSFITRIMYIERQIEIFKANPIFGRLASVGWSNTDNLYVSRLAYGGIIGLLCTLLIPFIFFRIHQQYKKISAEYSMPYHLFLSNLLYWSAFAGLMMGVAWDFFVGNRTMSFFMFLYGLLAGQLPYFPTKIAENKMDVL